MKVCSQLLPVMNEQTIMEGMSISRNVLTSYAVPIKMCILLFCMIYDLEF